MAAAESIEANNYGKLTMKMPRKTFFFTVLFYCAKTILYSLDSAILGPTMDSKSSVTIIHHYTTMVIEGTLY